MPIQMLEACAPHGRFALEEDSLVFMQRLPPPWIVYAFAIPAGIGAIGLLAIDPSIGSMRWPLAILIAVSVAVFALAYFGRVRGGGAQTPTSNQAADLVASVRLARSVETLQASRDQLAAENERLRAAAGGPTAAIPSDAPARDASGDAAAIDALRREIDELRGQLRRAEIAAAGAERVDVIVDGEPREERG